MKLRAAATAALAVTALMLAGCSSGLSDESTTGAEHSHSSAAGADINDADVLFASTMIVHHEQAIEMSDIILDKGGANPEVTALAEDIKAAQGPEIAQLQGWLDEWGVDPDDAGGSDDAGHAGHGGIDGMMSEDDLAALDAADGPEASRLFLEQMIVHHEGAVEMAQAQIDDGSNSAAIELAQTIIDAQTAEIQLMNDLLAGF